MHLAAALAEGEAAVEECFDKGFETWTVAYATPTGPGRCRLMARFPFRFPAPDKPKKGLMALLPFTRRAWWFGVKEILREMLGLACGGPTRLLLELLSHT